MQAFVWVLASHLKLHWNQIRPGAPLHVWCKPRQVSQYGLPVCGCCQVIVREKGEGSNIHSKNVRTFEQRATGVILGMQMKLYQQHQWLNSIIESKYWHRYVKTPLWVLLLQFQSCKDIHLWLLPTSFCTASAIAWDVVWDGGFSTSSLYSSLVPRPPPCGTEKQGNPLVLFLTWAWRNYQMANAYR